MNHHTVIYSHGFGVQKDDRGLFSDIAISLQGMEHILFDYNTFDTKTNNLTVSPLNAQADILLKQVKEAHSQRPQNRISLICHSQGCVAAALAAPEHIGTVIFLAPPASFASTDQQVQQMLKRKGTQVLANNEVLYPRRDGTTTLIPSAYWESREELHPIALYNKLAQSMRVIIINATEDEVLTDKDFRGLDESIEVISIRATHDFTGDARPQLLSLIREKLI